MRATGAKVPPRRNAALLSANYPAATNFPLLSSRVPSPSPPLPRFICQESTCPVKKYSFRQRDTSAIRTNSNFLSLERERENGTMSFHYIISPIDRFIIDVQSIPVPFYIFLLFFFFLFRRTVELSYPRLYNETMRIPLLPRSVLSIARSIVQPCQLCLRDGTSW